VSLEGEVGDEAFGDLLASFCPFAPFPKALGY